MKKRLPENQGRKAKGRDRERKGEEMRLFEEGKRL